MDKNEYHRRREKLFETIGDGVAILPAYDYKTMSNDVHYEFRQQSDFLYFTGFEEPNSVALFEGGKEKKYSLFVPKKDKNFEIWNGRRYGVEGAIKIFGADEAFQIEEFEEKFKEIVKEYTHVSFPKGENVKFENLVLSIISNVSKSKERQGQDPINITDLTYDLHKIRLIKSEYELNIIRKSAEISSNAMILGMKVTKVGMKESDVEAVIEYQYAKYGAVRPAYPSIVGAGENATILHYIKNNDYLKNNDLLLIDAGAEYLGYASDITRTWPINGKFTDEQKEIYEIVLNCQKRCIEAVKPGVTINILQKLAVEEISKGLLKLGLVEGDLSTIIDEEKYKRYFMHGIGHFLGLDVHDTSMLGRDYELTENSYITIEPGIYIPNEDDIPIGYRGIGIRIEDDILVTVDGNENLTKKVPKEISEIERIVGTIEIP
ncbi:MAG: aminopeptidase P N-terminal domain-containing protein [Asgard group archaeon]|nr:aminopeptidase P N-terminal domain-containing protein [Asgard group archaeon]